MTYSAVDEVFKGLPGGPVEIVEQQKRWIGTVMTFGLTAKLGFVKYPMRGTVESDRAAMHNRRRTNDVWKATAQQGTTGNRGAMAGFT